MSPGRGPIAWAGCPASTQGLEDTYAGRTRSAHEALAELRRKYHLPESP